MYIVNVFACFVFSVGVVDGVLVFRSYINRPEVIEECINPLYEPNPSIIWPSVAPQSLVNNYGSYVVVMYCE